MGDDELYCQDITGHTFPKCVPEACSTVQSFSITQTNVSGSLNPPVVKVAVAQVSTSGLPCQPYNWSSQALASSSVMKKALGTGLGK